jgi:lysophospholipase L1-like esterase
VRTPVTTPVTIVEARAAAPAEQVSPPAALATVTPQNGTAVVEPGLQWSCTRLVRGFTATQAAPDGSSQTASISVTTPSCATRLGLKVAHTRLHRGYPVPVTAVDHWHLGGLRVRACLAHGRHPACAAATIAPGSSRALLRPTATSAGRPVLMLSDPYQTLRAKLLVRSSRPLLLATGDSQMQVLDELIGNDLSGAGVRVRGDAKQSTAISSPFFFNWPAHAAAQVAAEHPDIVAMFIGGNDGFRLGSAECCGEGWSREYADRVAGMISDYRQGGAATVYWFLIPTPSREPYVRVARAVDLGIELAAARFREGVHLFDLRPEFSPGGRYINSKTVGGHTFTVHESDGFHLSSAADGVVARMFVERLRADGLLR